MVSLFKFGVQITPAHPVKKTACSVRIRQFIVIDGIAVYTGARVPAKIIQARAVFASRLRTM